MTPAEYDAWYDTPRGRWIGETEFRLLQRQLALQPFESLLDVGCGTGWFTRRFAAGNGWYVTGLDNDPARLAFARAHAHNERYRKGDARALRYADASIDRVVSVAALCVIDDWRQVLSEMARVARRRVVVGLLNRHSLLWREKGRGGGDGRLSGRPLAQRRRDPRGHGGAAVDQHPDPHRAVPARRLPAGPRRRTRPAEQSALGRLSRRGGEQDLSYESSSSISSSSNSRTRSLPI
jgi:SAM-dependent methyltransferase